MDMNKSFCLKKEDRAPKWHIIDASDKVLGRLATQVADILRGKDKPEYTPHTDSGDYVVVTNCNKIVLTGNKWEGKLYTYFTGWRSGQKKRSARQIFEKDSSLLIKHAVKGMLPKNKLSNQIIKKLKVYGDDNHPHKAQIAKYGAKTN